MNQALEKVNFNKNTSVKKIRENQLFVIKLPRGMLDQFFSPRAAQKMTTLTYPNQITLFVQIQEVILKSDAALYLTENITSLCV
jgi:hypothetical protein